MREKKEINLKIGEQIKLSRENLKLTQEALSELIEVSPQYVSDLERGVVGVSIGTLKKICLALHVSSDRLLFGADSESRSAAIAEKCKSLSEQQFNAVLEIIEKITDMIPSQKEQTP